MEEQNHTFREYSLRDFGKVFLACLKKGLICALIVAVIVGGALTCVATLATHSEYTATVTKLDLSYDVPIIRDSFKERIRNILREMYEERSLTAEQLEDLSNEVNNHLELTVSEENAGVYTFTLSSFKSSVLKISDEEFSEILERIVTMYKDSYADKIVSNYIITFTDESALRSNTPFTVIESLNYYLQTEFLYSYLDSSLQEIKSVAGINQIPVVEFPDSIVITFPRSDFVAYSCKENNRRVGDSLRDLESLYLEIAYAQSYISSHGVEKAGTNSMPEYINGQLLRDPSNEKWRNLQTNWNPDGEAATEEEVAETERLIREISQKLYFILDDYNLIARSYAQSIVKDYVFFSELDVQHSIGAIDFGLVAVITVVCALFAFLICYFIRFSKMQKEGSIGTETIEEPDEP